MLISIILINRLPPVLDIEKVRQIMMANNFSIVRSYPSIYFVITH